MSRTVSWFSCGAASAVATMMDLAQHRRAGNGEFVIARCIVREEHPDNDRFAADCEKWFGHPITNLINAKYDGSIYSVFEHRQYISGINGAPCTLLLKKQVREAFHKPRDRHVFGYTAEEQGRWDKFLDANNIDAVAPLIDAGVTHADCLAMVERAGIVLPEMYKLGFHHNNCIGCGKATGQGYWNKIRIHFPPQFNHMAALSRRLGVKLVETNDSGSKVRIFLDELQPGTGNYAAEPEIQCGIFCEMAEQEYRA